MDEFGVPRDIFKIDFTYKPVKQLWINLRGRRIGEQPRAEYSTKLGNTMPDIDGFTTVDLTIGTKKIIDFYFKTIGKSLKTKFYYEKKY